MTEKAKHEALILMKQCLARLDALGAPIAAAHIDAAIYQAQVEFNLDASSSISD